MGYVVLFLIVVAFRASAQAQVPGCEIRTEEGGRVNNASTSSADLSARVPDGRLILGRKVFFDDHTSVVGAFVGLGNGASVFDVDADSVHRAKGAIVRGVVGPFSAEGAFCEAPAVECGSQDVSVPKKGKKSLTPGTYGQVTLDNGASLTLAPGTYTVCQLRTGRHVKISVTGVAQSTINVRDEVRIHDASTFEPMGSTPTPVLNVRGDSVHIGAHATVRAFITAPSARLVLGDGSTFSGAACARLLSAGRKVRITCAPEVSTTTTTSSSSTSTTTSSPSTSTTTSSTSTTSTSPSTSTTTTSVTTSTTTTSVTTSTSSTSPPTSTSTTSPPTSTSTTSPPTSTTTTSSSTTTTTSIGPTTHTVMVGPGGSLVFSPASLTIQVGDTVHWVWASPGHSVVSGANGTADNQFCSPSNTSCDNPPLSVMGATYDHTFTTAGTFPYYCSVHSTLGMTGTIIVQ